MSAAGAKGSLLPKSEKAVAFRDECVNGMTCVVAPVCSDVPEIERLKYKTSGQKSNGRVGWPVAVVSQSGARVGTSSCGVQMVTTHPVSPSRNCPS